MNKNTSLLVIIVLAAIGFFVYVQSGLEPAIVDQKVAAPASTDQPESKTMPALGENGTEMEVVDAADNKVVEIEAGSFYYKPNVITLKKGEKVTLKLKSVSMMHDFKIDALNFSIPVTKNGEEATVEFTPTQTGTFEYYCSVGNGYHKKMGQVGNLTVVE